MVALIMCWTLLVGCSKRSFTVLCSSLYEVDIFSAYGLLDVNSCLYKNTSNIFKLIYCIRVKLNDGGLYSLKFSFPIQSLY